MTCFAPLLLMSSLISLPFLKGLFPGMGTSTNTLLFFFSHVFSFLPQLQGILPGRTPKSQHALPSRPRADPQRLWLESQTVTAGKDLVIISGGFHLAVHGALGSLARGRKVQGRWGSLSFSSYQPFFTCFTYWTLSKMLLDQRTHDLKPWFEELCSSSNPPEKQWWSEWILREVLHLNGVVKLSADAMLFLILIVIY